jgi:hypothetical protein
LLLPLLVFLSAGALEANIITDENAKPGTTEWTLFSSAANEIEGYASLTSASPGESIRLYVNTTSQTYTIEVFRMGWYGGKGGRRMTSAVTRNGIQQPIPQPDAFGMVECNWSDPYVLTIPEDWVSGVYLAKLTAQPSKKGAYIIFVVRSERAAAFTAVTAATTWQAYNNWGGKSLYPFNSTGEHAVKVSFNRPYAPASGAGDFLYGAGFPMVRFLEREGYDVTYTTDLDTHERGADILHSSAYLVIDHDEYWTREMRDAVTQARDRGVNLAFFSANVCYWQIRLESSPITGERDRTMVGYKDFAAARDPVLFDSDPTNNRLATTKFRDLPVNDPEDALIGTMYTYATVKDDLVIGDTSHWVFANSGLHPGDHIRGALGYEADRSTFTSYPGTIVLTHSPFLHADGTPDESNMTIYTAQSGAIVFATGTIYWNWTLDDFNAAARPNTPVSAATQQITRNVLNRILPEPPARRRASRR